MYPNSELARTDIVLRYYTDGNNDICTDVSYRQMSLEIVIYMYIPILFLFHGIPLLPSHQPNLMKVGDVINLWMIFDFVNNVSVA